MDYLDQVFGPGGVFASQFPGYQTRPPQVDLARQIEHAIAAGGHLLAEAPTGTGKSAAQCVPAIFHAANHDKRVVVVTANIALQEQLTKKDLPLLRDLLPWPFRFAVLKGKSNYACAEKLVQLRSRQRDLFGDAGLDRQVGQVLEWAKSSHTGDSSDLPFSPSARTWADVSVTSETCLGSSCPSLEKCFVERARIEAQNAHVVVTNYHVLGAHIAARLETGNDCVLPPHDVLILDEAHAAAGILRDCLGFRLVARDLDEMVQAARQAFGKHELGAIIERAHLLDYLGQRVRGERGRKGPVRAGADVVGLEVSAAIDALSALAEKRAGDMEGEGRAAWQRLARKAKTIASRVTEATECSDANKVYWVEVDFNDRVTVCASPIDVAPILRRALFDATKTVCLLSATLAVEGHFGFIRRELGVPSTAAELVVDSPFEYPRQSLLVVPAGMPEPTQPEFPEACAKVVQEVVDRCEGRTLGLFTSYRNLNAVAERLQTRHRVLKQGDLPRNELIRLFKEDEHSVLLGTDSFWTGIDVPGPALTAVVIDKLPFPSPDEPVIAALAQRDKNGFATQLLPRAIIKLKQGVGRLVRTQSDIGTVVICDGRLRSKRYGDQVLRSLPPMLRSSRLAAISEFLPEEERHAALPR
jgi:ATP-dependent DNA helicase DinG